MATPKVYVICDQKCLYEGMTKEQILAAIAQAVENGTIGDCDTGFIQTVKTINGLPLRFFVGEQHEYNELTDEQKENLYAIITNDVTQDGITAAITELQSNYTSLRDGLQYGDFVPNKANMATKDGVGNNIVETYERKASRTVYSKTNFYGYKIKTGFDYIVYLGNLVQGKTLDKIVGMCIELELATDTSTINLYFSAAKSSLSRDDGNGTNVIFSFNKLGTPSAQSFEIFNIDAKLYLIENELHLCFAKGAYAWYAFNVTEGKVAQTQCYDLASDRFTLKSVSWWYA